MKKDKTLLIMAAGMGSRFGGLKQIEPVGPNGEFIIDYSIYDAIRSGFNKVVFVIKEENYAIFRDTIGKRIEDKVKVEYVFQKLDDLPNGIEVPAGREKPWGTGQAILCAKDYINEPFVVINADDFYGSDAFATVSKFLDNKYNTVFQYGLGGYKICNTLSENGMVKRGLFEQKEGYLTKFTESKVERINGEIVATAIETNITKIIPEDHSVSMSLFAFTPDLFELLESDFKEFLDTNDIKNNLECELFIPTVLENNIIKNIISLEVLETDAVWYGITYKEEKELVENAIKQFIQNKVYPQNLWEA